MSQLHNFLRVTQNIYQSHNFCQIRISLFRLGIYIKPNVCPVTRRRSGASPSKT